MAVDLTNDMVEKMAKIRKMIKEVNGIVDDLENAFDSCDLKLKKADSEIKQRVDAAIAASKT